MSMSPKEVESLARELLTASETGQMVEFPPSQRPGFDLDTAYQVESALKELREAAGHRAIGQKVGYANKAMWRILKLETLVWAHMYDDTVHYSDHNSATLSPARPRSLKIEPEIVFGLKEAMAVGGPLQDHCQPHRNLPIFVSLAGRTGQPFASAKQGKRKSVP